MPSLALEGTVSEVGGIVKQNNKCVNRSTLRYFNNAMEDQSQYTYRYQMLVCLSENPSTFQHFWCRPRNEEAEASCCSDSGGPHIDYSHPYSHSSVSFCFAILPHSLDIGVRCFAGNTLYYIFSLENQPVENKLKSILLEFFKKINPDLVIRNVWFCIICFFARGGDSIGVYSAFCVHVAPLQWVSTIGGWATYFQRG